MSFLMWPLTAVSQRCGAVRAFPATAKVGNPFARWRNIPEITMKLLQAAALLALIASPASAGENITTPSNNVPGRRIPAPVSPASRAARTARPPTCRVRSRIRITPTRPRACRIPVKSRAKLAARAVPPLCRRRHARPRSTRGTPVFNDCFCRDRGNLTLGRRTGSHRLRSAGATQHGAAFMDRRNAIMAFSGILASSALVAMPRRPAFAQTAGRVRPSEILPRCSTRRRPFRLERFPKRPVSLRWCRRHTRRSDNSRSSR